MTDQVQTPGGSSEEEPIPLEPISLEPVSEEQAAALEQVPAPAAEVEPVAPTASESTSEYPSVSALPPPLPAKSTDEATGAETPPAAPAIASPSLVVVRGQRMDVKYPIYPGKNYLGRTDDKPVDIDLEDQEAQDRIWTSRQHAVITFEEGRLTIEDLNSLNGTFVNRNRVHPGQLKELQENDVVQVGTVHLKVVIG